MLNSPAIHRTTAAAALVVALGLTGFAVPAGAAVPTNDDFANRTEVIGASGSILGSTVDATLEADDPGFANSVWYRWTAPATGWFTFSTDIDTAAFPEGDTVVDIFTGSALTDLQLLQHNDDFGGTLESRVTLAAVAGTEYVIAVNAFLPEKASEFVLAWEQVFDTTPPETTLSVSAPARNTVHLSIAATDDLSDPGHVHYSMSIDGGQPFESALTDITLYIAGGLHTFSVAAVDESGNIDPTPATGQVRVRGPHRAVV